MPPALWRVPPPWRLSSTRSQTQSPQPHGPHAPYATTLPATHCSSAPLPWRWIGWPWWLWLPLSPPAAPASRFCASKASLGWFDRACPAGARPSLPFLRQRAAALRPIADAQCCAPSPSPPAQHRVPSPAPPAQSCVPSPTLPVHFATSAVLHHEPSAASPAQPLSSAVQPRAPPVAPRVQSLARSSHRPSLG